MSRIHLAAVSPDRPPLDPTASQARAQLAHELAKAQYDAARPSVIQNAIQWLENWFNSLFNFSPTGVPDLSGLVIVIIVVVAIVAIVIGFLVFGLPRINRRSAAGGALFGDEDDRDSLALRRAAERAAASGDFATAIEEGFRAIAIDLTERLIVTSFPGTTAHSFALQAGRDFPAFDARLRAAANVFDGVRYLGSAASEGDWLEITSLGDALRSAKPVLESADA